MTVDAHDLRAAPRADRPAPVSVDAARGEWWPWIALVLGVLVIVVGGILFSP